MKFYTLLALLGVTQAIQLGSHQAATDVDGETETRLRALLDIADLGKCGEDDGKVTEDEMDKLYQVLLENNVLPADVLQRWD